MDPGQLEREKSLVYSLTKYRREGGEISEVDAATNTEPTLSGGVARSLTNEYVAEIKGAKRHSVG